MHRWGRRGCWVRCGCVSGGGGLEEGWGDFEEGGGDMEEGNLGGGKGGGLAGATRGRPASVAQYGLPPLRDHHHATE